jgi:hypothetical protein
MYFTNYRAIPGKYFEEAINYPSVQPTVVVQFTPPSQMLDMSSRAAAHSFINFVVSANDDSITAIVTNGDVQSAVGGLDNVFDFEFTSFWSVSEIMNNQLVREDDDTTIPSQNKIDYAYPSPFYYNKSYLFGSSIYVPFNVSLGEPVDFNVYTSAMELVFRNEETIKFLPGEQVGIIWDTLNNKSEKLASGVYIYVVQKGDDVVKGKLVIFN